MILLLTSMVAAAFSEVFSVKGNPHVSYLDSRDSQSADRDHTSYSAGVRSSQIQGFRTETGWLNTPSFDFFIKDLNSHKTDDWRSLAYVDEDSAELVIGLNDAQPEGYAKLANLIVEKGGTLVNTISIRDKAIAVVADIPFDSLSSLVARMQEDSIVRYVEPNVKFQAQFVPDDSYYVEQWAPWRIEAEWAWNTTLGDPSVLVAVIDTGVDYDHPDLAANYVELGYDWVNDDDDPMDDYGHGTHCAGIIAAEINNGEGIAGLAQVRIMAEKGLDAGGWGFEDGLAEALIHAVDQGADILSNSWGGSMDSLLIHDAVKYAYDRGVLVVAAAGNSGTNIKLYPAAYDEVVAVTATRVDDNPAYFTSFGDWVEVAAPGVDIFSTIWDNSYDYKSGTSMACPHVAGVAALIWSQFPNVTRDWVRAQLRYTGVDLGEPSFDEYYGYGRIDANEAVNRAPQEHDLLIFDWQKPSRIQPGDTASFRVSVLNFGANDEQNVTVQLLIEGNETDSTVISLLAKGASTSASLSWSPLVEGTYNVTLHVVPVSGETIIDNNVITKMISVRYPVGFVLFDQTRCDPIMWYSKWVANLTERGYVVDTYTAGTITPETLADYDVFVIPQAWYRYSWDEILAIQDFVLNGKGLLVIGDDSPTIYRQLTSFAGIEWDYYYGWSGYTSDITPHDVTEGVTSAYFDSPISHLIVSSPATDIIRDGYWHKDIMLAVSEVATGRVIGIADENTVGDFAIENGDNFILANNMIDWLLGAKYEHELTVRLDAPQYLEPGETTLLNATVYNRGLSNETDVELRLFINGTLAHNITIPKLVNGTSYTTSYSWTPTVEAMYNVTAYAPPVTGENVTINNRRTKFVSVHYPLINPVEGQYANYALNYYDSSGSIIGTGYWNFVYDHYVDPHRIYITMELHDPSGYNLTDSMIVNTMNRYVESGAWAGQWYPGWIETNIDIGSEINLLSTTATVNGTSIIIVGPRAVECWEICPVQMGYQYSFFYDKSSGLWISLEATDYYGSRVEVLLTETNVPVGIQHEHDLGVSLEVPQRLQPGETSLLNATVYNLGMNSETDVKLQLLINGTEVASKTVDELVNGTWHSISYLWASTSAGIYNITAYTTPVPSENVTINNAATKMVYVRYIEVALISDYSELTSITPILNSMGIGYDIYNNNAMNLYTEDLSLLLKYKIVVFGKGHRWITSNEYSTLESYLSSGGNLLVTGYDSLYNDQLLAKLVRSSSTGDNLGEYDLYVTDPTHPIMNGPYGSFPLGYHIYGLYGDCDNAEADTSRNAVTVAELVDGYDKIIATQGLPGKVVFWNGMGPIDWTLFKDCETMLKNMIQWFRVRYEHELIASLAAPSFLEPNDSTVLNATVRNEGLEAETNVQLQLLINGTVVEAVTIPNLANGTAYTISHPWTPTKTGTYNITVYVPPVPGENYTRNNVHSALVPVKYTTRILAYVQYADYYQEYQNTLRAIQSSFGPNYFVTELWDYTQLDSMLQGNDILLIPEQEYAGLSTMENIGRTWSDTLSDFLNGGGVIVVCDFGCAYGILTGSGLMSIRGTNYITYRTVYLVDQSDPLAKGVSPSFVAPNGAMSFVTRETNVVVDDGTYPVVIHKEVGRGHIVLLGFDFYSSNADTEQLLGNSVALAGHIEIFTDRCVGSPGAEVTVSGTKATPEGLVAIYWDDKLVGNTTANTVGEFTYLMAVPPDSATGTHEITAIDTVTSKRASTLFRVILITLNPNKGPAGTKVTVNGAGFLPEARVRIKFNDMLIGEALVDDFGSFAFTFNVPLSTAGRQIIKALETEVDYAEAIFKVIDVTPLDVEVDVGAIHFRGELAEFYTQIRFRGVAINATSISATLLSPDGKTFYYQYSQNITLVSTGFYKIAYALPLDASPGTYSLIVEARYLTSTIEARGTSFKSFLLSPTLTGWNALLISVNGTVGTIKTDLGFITVKLDAIDAKLVRIEENTVTINTTLGLIQADLTTIQLSVTAIDGSSATIQTILGTLEGRITSIEGDTATIETDIGTVRADISALRDAQQAFTAPLYVLIIPVLLIAVGTILLAYFMRKKP